VAALFVVKVFELFLGDLFGGNLLKGFPDQRFRSRERERESSRERD